MFWEFLSFRVTSYKALFYWEGRNVQTIQFFEDTVFYIKETYFSESIDILIEGWYIYFKLTEFADV